MLGLSLFCLLTAGENITPTSHTRVGFNYCEAGLVTMDG